MEDHSMLVGIIEVIPEHSFFGKCEGESALLVRQRDVQIIFRP